MANIDYALLTCSKPEMLESIVLNSNLANEQYDHAQNNNLWSFWFKNGCPFNEDVAAVSAKHPEIVFNATYSFEDNYHAELHLVEYKAGESNQTGMKPAYCCMANKEVKGLIPEDDLKELFKKAESLFRRCDAVKKNEEGHFCIEWFPEPVAVEVENERFKVIFWKREFTIEATEAYKANRAVSWQKLDNKNLGW